MSKPLALVVLILAVPAAAEKILTIGDSHTVGAFGQNLDDTLRAAKVHKVATYGVCSSRPQSYLSETPHGCGHLFRDFDKKSPAKWGGARIYKETRKVGETQKEVEMVKTPDFAQLLADHTPTVVIVALGSNLPISGSSVKTTLELIHKAGATCLWVGPPDMRNPTRAQVDKVYETLAASHVDASVTLDEAKKTSCRLIDSRKFEFLKYPAEGGGSGGTHYDGKLWPVGLQWGKAAAEEALKILTP